MKSLDDRLEEKELQLKTKQVELKVMESQMRVIRNDIIEIENEVNILKAKRDEEVKYEEELRIEIEKRVREEMSMRKKVDEELERMKNENVKNMNGGGEMMREESKVKCEVCKVWLCNIYSYQTHLISRKHKNVLLSQKEDISEDDDAMSVEEENNEISKKKKCDVCNKWLCDIVSYNKHLESMKHQRNVKSHG
jgi:hypothetical protein